MQMRGASTQRRREPSDPIVGFERERNNPGIPALKLKFEKVRTEDNFVDVKESYSKSIDIKRGKNRVKLPASANN